MKSAPPDSFTMQLRLLVLAFIGAAEAFSSPSRLGPVQQRAVAQRSSPLSMAVIDISSTEEFNKALESAGDSLVVVDYSTSWCGPCKIIAPKFEEFSEQYKNVAFLKACTPPEPPVPKQRDTATLLSNSSECVCAAAGDGRQQPRRRQADA